MTTQLAATKEKIDSFKKNITDLKSEKINLKSEYKEIKKQNDTLDKTVFEYKTKNTKQEKEIREMKSQIDNLKNKVIEQTTSKKQSALGLSGILGGIGIKSQPSMEGGKSRTGASSPLKKGGSLLFQRKDSAGDSGYGMMHSMTGNNMSPYQKKQEMSFHNHRVVNEENDD